MDTPREEAIAGQPPDDTTLVCDVCGGPAFEFHCKVICRRCGYTRDCSDP